MTDRARRVIRGAMLLSLVTGAPLAAVEIPSNDGQYPRVVSTGPDEWFVINAFVFPASTHGLCVAAGSTDADGFAEIAATQGPAPAQDSEVAVYDYDGVGLVEMAGSRFEPFLGPTSGAQVAFGAYADRDRALELYASQGPSPASPSEVRIQDDSAAGFAFLIASDPHPGQTHGVTEAGVATGF